jgi:predicted RND superfamily exporter protein
MTKDFDLVNNTRPHGTILIVQINGTLPGIEIKRIAGEVREATKDVVLRDIRIQQTSQPMIEYDVDENSRQTLALLAALSFGLIIFLLLISFKRFTYMLTPLLTVLLATIWTLGTMYIIGIPFSAMMVAVIPLIMGLGIDDSVHVSRRYQEELRNGKTVSDSIKITLNSVGVAITLTSITTIIAFLSNAFTGIPPVRDFGISVAIGIGYAWLVTVLFHSSFRYWVDSRALLKYTTTGRGKHPIIPFKKGKRGFYDGFSNGVSKAVRHHSKVIAVILVLATVGAFLAGTQVRSEFSLEEFLPNDWESVKAAEAIRDDFQTGGYLVSKVIVEADDIATASTLSAVNQLITNTADDEYVVILNTSEGSQVFSINIMMLAQAYFQNNESFALQYNLTVRGEPTGNTTDRDVRAFYDDMYNNETVIPLSGRTYRELAGSLIHFNSDSDSFDAMQIYIYIDTVTTEENRQMVVAISTIDLLFIGMVMSTAIAVFLSAVILVFLYWVRPRLRGDKSRSVAMGFMPVIPVIMASLWIVGSMFLLGISLNVLTIMVTALTIGLGIDFSIHVLERFKEEYAKYDANHSMHTTLMSTGTALSISALTTIIGFGVLIISPMPVVQQFGGVTAITILFSLLLAMLALPLLILVWARFHEKRKPPALEFQSLEKVDLKKVKYSGDDRGFGHEGSKGGTGDQMQTPPK